MTSGPEEITVALVSDVPLVIDGWKTALSNESDVEIALELSTGQLISRGSFPIPADVIVVEADWLITRVGRTWLRDLNGLNARPKVIAIAGSADQLARAQRAGADEALLGPIQHLALANLIRGLKREDKRQCLLYKGLLRQTGTDAEFRPAYERLVYSIAQLLFTPDLVYPRYVGGDAERSNLVFLNEASRGFWHEVRVRHGTEYVLFCVSSSSVRVDDVPSMSRYLDGPFGRLGFLVAREPFGLKLQAAQVAAYQNSDRAVIAISDDNLVEMLSLRAAHMEPLETLRGLYEELISSGR